MNPCQEEPSIELLKRIHARLLAMHSDAAPMVEWAVAQLEEYEFSNDLRWKADRRAITMWQAAHPGNDLRWPSHDDLCVWLMDQLQPAGKPS